MILVWTDPEGDPVAIESAAIVGVSFGKMTGPRDASTVDEATVTLIFTLGTGERPFMVAEPFAEVVKAWEAGRAASPPPQPYPGVIGWQQQYDPVQPLAGIHRPWRPMTGGPT